MAASETAIRDWCVAAIARMLALPAQDIDPQAPFARLGLDSASATYFIVELEEWLGAELDPEIVFEHPSIAELARHLASRPAPHP
jgi:acyl carrier protein